MINKSKIYKIICSLIIVLIIFIPIRAFAGVHSVKSWEEYREKVQEDIKKQETEITINFSGGLTFTSEDSVRNKVKIELQELIKNLPKHLGELNIKNIDNIPTAVKLKGTTNSPLESVTHEINYRSSGPEILALNPILKAKYDEVKFKATDYKKIEEVYNYIAYKIDINNELIKTIFASHGDNAPAFIVAMMMSELGYDNDIASSDSQSYKWNLVKVQGLWYHVDAKKENGLLFKENNTWNSTPHNGKKFASVTYDETKHEKLQLDYELILLEELMEKAEETKLKADIIIANNNIDSFKLLDGEDKYKEKINALNQRIDALEKFVELEVSMIKYVDDFSDVNKAEIETLIGDFDEAIEVLPEEIKVKEQYDNKLTLAGNTRDAIGKILEVEITELDNHEDKINSAREAITIEKISDKGIRDKLTSKLDIVEAHSIINRQISSAKGKIKSVDANTPLLSEVISEVNNLIVLAKSGLKNIKDTDFKKKKELEIKEIESLIVVLNAVVKAEKPPLKMTNVNSARKIVDKLDNKDIKDALILRLKNVEDKIGLSLLISNAIKAVEKAEKSMKDSDVQSAKESVKSIEGKPESGDLSVRLDAILAINNMEKNLASYLGDHSEGNKNLLSGTIDKADKATKDLNIDKYTIRITVASKTITAIDDINIAKYDQTTNAAITINTAKTSIATISDSKIKSVLEKELNVIISQMDIRRKTIEIRTAIDLAKDSVKHDNDLNENISAVKACEDIVKTLPTSSDKTAFQGTIKELNNVINAKKVVKAMEDKLEQKSLLLKDVLAVEKAVNNLEKNYRTGLEERVESLKEGLEGLDLDKAKAEVAKAEESAKSDIKNLSKNIATAKKSVDQVSINKGDEKAKLNNRIKALDAYVSTVKVLGAAEKTVNVRTRDTAQVSLEAFQLQVENVAVEDGNSIYNYLVGEITARIKSINDYLSGADEKLNAALTRVVNVEELLIGGSDPDYVLMQEVQSLVDLVIDNTERAKLQKRIDDIKLVNEAKLAVAKAEANLVEKSVKDAEIILDKIDGKYAEIITNLSARIIVLKDKLDLSKKVAEAIKLFEKASISRSTPDTIMARSAIDGIIADKKTYDNLNARLIKLEESINNEEEDQITTSKAAEDALKGLHSKINEINIAIVNITQDKENEKETIQNVYVMITDARIQIIEANAAVTRLKEKGTLLSQIDGGKKELDLAEDKLHVKEAIRLITIVSSSVNKPKNDIDKPKATLDIAAAKRAIDRITHNENKAVKVTLLNTLKAFELKLTSDNDQELIDLAIEAVNNAADVFSKALKEDKVMVEQENIDKAIISAKVSIIGISDTNKSAKDSLNGFINEIETMYKDEKAGVANEVYITKAEAAVILAETSKLEGNIRSARLRVQMIKPINPESVLKISKLTLRLDVLEGKVDKTPDPSKPDATKPGTTKPGATKPSGETSIIKVPTNPLPSKERDTEINEPKWGQTKELKKKSPLIKFPYY